MKTWLITGVSSGLGQALAQALIARGDNVAGTVRNEAARREFEALAPQRAIGVLLDVTDHASIATAVKQVQARLGHIDVLVNNAGYGVQGAIEATPLEVVRQQYEVNVFGAIAMIQAVLPDMRARRSGHIVNITSVGGLLTYPGVGIYNSSKFALEGISEALSKEVSHLNIHVTAVEPGAFRTDWAGRSMHHIENAIADYEPSVGAFRAGLAQRNGRQPGDPRKAAAAIMLAVDAAHPPLHLVLGPAAFAQVGQKLGAMQAELMQWAPVSVNTDFAPEA